MLVRSILALKPGVVAFKFMIATWTSEAKDLKRQRAALEREIALAVQSLRKEAPATASELETLARNSDSDRTKEKQALLQQCDRLKVRITSILTENCLGQVPFRVSGDEGATEDHTAG